MPIDPAIPLQVRPPEQIDPMGVLGKVLTLRNQQAQAVNQQQEQQLRGQQIQQNDLQLAAQQRVAAGRQALTTILQFPDAYDPTTMQPQHAKVAQQLAQAGFSDEAEAWLKQSSTNAEALDKLQSTAKAHAEAAQEAIGGLAATASSPKEFDASVGILASQGILDAKTAQQVIAQADAGGPDGWNALRQQFVHLAPSSRAATLKAQNAMQEPTKLGPGEQLVVPGSGQVLASTPVKPPNAQSESFLLDGKAVKGAFVPDAQGGKYLYNGQDVTSRAKPIPTQASVTVQQTNSDASAVADAIVAGEQPPDVKGLYRMAGPVRAELAKRGYDLTTANLDWQATQKHVQTLNGQKFTSLRSSIATASQSLDVIQELADQWKGGRFPILNKANLIAAKNGAYGKDAASIATQLEGQITDVTSELGNVYMGGNSPTDKALGLAEKNLKGEWDQKVLTDMISLARKNLQIRGNSIAYSTPAGLSTQPSAPSAMPAVEEWVRDPKTGKLTKKGGS